MKILDTKRLHINKLDPTYDRFIYELLNDPGWIRFIGDRGIKTLADAQKYIANGPMESYRVNGFGLYVVKLKGSEIPIGISGLIKREGLEDVDIGYAFLPQYRGMGYALEAAVALLEYAHKEIGLKKVVAITNPDNEDSIKLLLNAGMHFEKFIRLNGDAIETKLFAIIF